MTLLLGSAHSTPFQFHPIPLFRQHPWGKLGTGGPGNVINKAFGHKRVNFFPSFPSFLPPLFSFFHFPSFFPPFNDLICPRMTIIILTVTVFGVPSLSHGLEASLYQLLSVSKFDSLDKIISLLSSYFLFFSTLN